MSNAKKFHKVLNSWDLLVTAFGAMIGWGWVVMSGDWLVQAGTLGTAVGYLFAGIMIYFVGLTYAELSSAMPTCGGELVFSYKALGPGGAFVCTWAMTLSYVGVVCFEACSLPTVLQYIIPNFLQGYLYSVAGFDIYASWLIVAILTAVFITYINLINIKTATFVQTILTIVIAGAGLILIAGSAINGSVENLSTQFFLGDDLGGKVKNMLVVAAVAPFMLMGFDVLPQVAEENNVPLQKTGKLLLLSIVLAVSFYVLVVFFMGYILNHQEVLQSVENSGLTAADAMAKAFGSKAMAKVLILGGACGILTSWNSFVIGGSRVICAMANACMIPRRFSIVSTKHHTPMYAILLIGLLSVIAPFFGRKMLVWVADASSFACCITYFFVAISFLVLRKTAPDMPRPFRIKHPWIVGAFAAVISGFMVLMYIVPVFGATLTPQEWIIVGGWTFLGICFAAACKVRYKKQFGQVRVESKEP